MAISKKQFPERLELNGWDTFQHYFFVIAILVVPVFTYCHHFSKNIPFQDFPYAETALILLALFFIYRQYRVLSFKKYSINHTAKHFEEAVEATATELSWEIDTLDQDEAIAYQRDVPMQTEGIRITILRDDTRIYFNSIINPYFGSNPFSWGRHRKNLQVFSKNLVTAAKGIEVLDKVKQQAIADEARRETEDEWNLTNTIKRIIIYLVILALMLFSVFMVAYATGISIIPVLIFGVCVAYIVMDIHIILKKNRSKQANKHT